MNTRGLLIATVLLAALGGLLYWSNHHKKSDDTDPTNKILSLKQDDISGLDLKRKNGEEDTLARTKDKSGWQMTAPRPLNANAQTISEILSLLSALKADHVVADKATDLSQYGLAPAQLTLTVSESNGVTHKLLIGDSIPGGTNFYAALEGDPRVFALTSYDKSSLDKTGKDLADLRLLPVDDDKISSIEMVEPKQDIAFTQKDGSWQVQKPQAARADEAQVNRFLHDVESAQINLNIPAQAVAQITTAFASASNIATIKIADAAGTKTLEVRKMKEGFTLAKSSAVDGIYPIPPTLAQDLEKTADDFISKKLFDFGYEIPDQIGIHDGPANYSMTRKDTQWSSNGKTPEPMSVETLISKLRDLSATSFAQSGYTTPAIEITVTSNDHHKIEKVQIAKNGSDYIAKRDNDATLYVLDATAVSALQKAAADVQSADAAKKNDGSGSATTAH